MAFLLAYFWFCVDQHKQYRMLGNFGRSTQTIHHDVREIQFLHKIYIYLSSQRYQCASKSIKIRSPIRSVGNVQRTVTSQINSPSTPKEKLRSAGNRAVTVWFFKSFVEVAVAGESGKYVNPFANESNGKTGILFSPFHSKEVPPKAAVILSLIALFLSPCAH